MKFYKRFPGDIQIKTGGLTMAEFGAYDRLLDHYYATEEPIPPNEVYSIARAMSKADRDAVDKVLSRYFALDASGRYAQHRADEMIAEAQPKIEAARTNGRRGGRPTQNPNGTKPEPTGLGNGTQPEPNAKASQSQSNSKTKSTTKPVAALPLPDWLPAEIWEAWRAERRDRKKAMTVRAENEGIRTLADLRDKGHDPTAVIRQSIANGWSGLFEVKVNGQRAPPNGKSVRQAEAEKFLRDFTGAGDGHSDSGRPAIDSTAERIADRGD